jgi:hypothetical protein
MLSSDLDRELHGTSAHHVTHSVPAIHDRRRSILVGDADVRGRMDEAGADPQSEERKTARSFASTPARSAATIASPTFDAWDAGSRSRFSTSRMK